jgi:hypothetical protein
MRNPKGADVMPGVLWCSPELGAITGKVVRELSEEPLAGVTVVAASPRCSSATHTAFTDEDGTYAMSGVPTADDYIVTFFYDDLQLQRTKVHVQRGETTQVDQTIHQPALDPCAGAGACARVPLLGRPM